MRITMRNWVIGVAAPVLLLVAWWFLSADSTDPFFPPLQTILVRFQELWLFEHFQSDVLLSLGNLFLGFVIAAAAGIALGFITALVAPVRWMLDPLIHFLRGIPPVALVPIFISLIGFGTQMRVTSIALAALFPTMIATVDGIRSVSNDLLDVSRVYRLTRKERVLKVLLPAATPQIFSGLQVSLQVAFIVMIASEMLGSSQGIGAMTLLAQQSFMTADMWAGILLLGVIGFLVNILFSFLRRRVLSWYIGSRRLARAS
ncbi:ABC-type nitrate/sulfonate/bicarbonate transport system permease component [Paenarthrobacter nicotinovorans]|uniref:ABC-type nitrate/sulfonate/bicarbonate transport system permease component n=1 Tax=Paenarthrobacter nicotinovorans TaxID=29320 RepID=A0ABT9TJY6_PAENI|nr:ABC transporter permease [Paenarthrobacter nicotinovorans]MDQ0101263.1 ABC-type nitrate/sulfonate/bicarbonate transport system permease component [Paenarthrobacter nicotinovorans]